MTEGDTAGGEGAQPAFNTWELTGVLVREEYSMPWVPAGQTPGLEAADCEGVDAKYFGKNPASGPFAYLVRFPPGSRMGARRHTANLMQFVLAGRADIDDRPFTAGWYAYVPAGEPVGAIAGGDQECRVMELFDGPPGMTPVSP